MSAFIHRLPGIQYNSGISGTPVTQAEIHLQALATTTDESSTVTYNRTVLSRALPRVHSEVTGDFLFICR